MCHIDMCVPYEQNCGEFDKIWFTEDMVLIVSGEFHEFWIVISQGFAA